MGFGARTLEEATEGRDGLSAREEGAGHGSGRTGEYATREALAVEGDIGLGYEGTHGMTEEEDRPLGILFRGSEADLMKVVYHSPKTVLLREPAEFGLVGSRLSVASMIGGIDEVAGSRGRLRETFVASAMLRHAVRDDKNRRGLTFGNPMPYVNRFPVISDMIEVSGFHRKSSLVTLVAKTPDLIGDASSRSTLVPTSKTTSLSVYALAITLVQALASGDKMDWIVQKAVELGAVAVQPVAAEALGAEAGGRPRGEAGRPLAAGRGVGLRAIGSQPGAADWRNPASCQISGPCRRTACG